MSDFLNGKSDTYLYVLAKKNFFNSLLKTESLVKSYVPRPLSASVETKTPQDPIKMFYTALGESYMPTREEYDFVTKGGTSGGQKFVPRIALAIARNRATPKMDVYYKRIEELSRTYRLMKRNPWVLNRILRVMDRGFLKPTTPLLKKEYSVQEGFCSYVLPRRWETLAESVTAKKRNTVWQQRTSLVRGMIESDWLENTFPMFKNRVFVKEVILLTEDDVQNNVGSSGQNTIRYTKPKLWGNPPPAVKPHVDILEKPLSSSFIRNPKNQVYENMDGTAKDVFMFLKNTMPRWRIPTESGFLLENLMESSRQEKETERNMKRRATPITQLKELVDEETSEAIGFQDSSADPSDSEEGPRALEMFEYLENPLAPTQMYKWGCLEPASEKEFLEVCRAVEKEKQEIRDSLAEEFGEGMSQNEQTHTQKMGSNETLPEDQNSLLLETDRAVDGSIEPLLPTQRYVESNRISLKTRRYFTSPRSRSDSSYHKNQSNSPDFMGYSLSYFLSRWPKSTNTGLDGWVSEVKKILKKCGGVLGLLEKKEFQLVSSLAETLQAELVQNLKRVSLPSKDGRTLDINRAYSKNIMRSGCGATADKIAEQSSKLLSFSRKKAFPTLLSDSVIRRALPVLDIKKVFTGGGTRKHSVVNHITEKRSGFNTIRWLKESAFKNPRNTRMRAVSTLSKELLSMSKPGKPSYAQQQRSKVYSEIWALMGRPDQAGGDSEDGLGKKIDLKKSLKTPKKDS